MRQPGETILTLLSRADEALYLAKSQGRDRVACETDVLVHALRKATGETPVMERRKYRAGGAFGQPA